MKYTIKILLLLSCAGLTLPAITQNARQFYKTGQTFAEAGNMKDAVDQFTRALDMDPEYIEAYIDRSRAFEALGELQKALDDLKRALAFEQKEEELYYNGARLYFLLEQYPDALEMINKSLDLNRKYELAYRLLCRIQLGQENYSQALAAIRKALDLKDNPENYFYSGQVAEKMKNYVQAESDYLQAVKKNTGFMEAYLALASLQLYLNKPEAAMKSCNAVLDKESGNREAYLIRSRIYARLTEYPKAIDDISKNLHNNPEDKEMYLVRGNYYQEFTQHQNAISDFTRALMIDNSLSEAIYRRAYSFEQTGEFTLAIKDYENLIRLSSKDPTARQYRDDARKRLYDLNRETIPPKIVIQEPAVLEDSSIRIPLNVTSLLLRGKITEQSELNQVTVNNEQVTFIRSGEINDFIANVDISTVDYITVVATDAYDNTLSDTYILTRTEIDPPVIGILEPYASDNGEIFLDTDDSTLYFEGNIHDESMIKSIVLEGVSASFTISDLNPRFSATLNMARRDTFQVTATDIYGNDTSQTFVLNRGGVSPLEANAMGRTWVIFIENSNYENFPSLDGPARDVALMRAALARYDIHKIIHKKDMTKMELERFISIELRDLLRTNKVSALLIWYAGHGRVIHETGYWIPVDARRDDEFTHYNLNALRASLQSYVNYTTHNLVVTDACEPGPALIQSVKDPRERSCQDLEAAKLKSSQVFSSAGYEMAVDDPRFTSTFADALSSNTLACLAIETIVNKVMQTVTEINRQTPKFGKIRELVDEDGTFFFMLR